MKGARINFGVPNSEYVLLADDDGVAVSLKNQDTDTEYIGGGGGERGANPVNLTWVDLPDSFDIETPLFSAIKIKAEEGYEDADLDTNTSVGGWDGEWMLTPQILAYPTKAEVGEYAFVISQAYIPAYRIVVKSGDADDSDLDWLEVYGDCTLSIEAIE